MAKSGSVSVRMGLSVTMVVCCLSIFAATSMVKSVVMEFSVAMVACGLPTGFS